MFAKKRLPFTKINDELILIHQESMASMNFNTCNSYIAKLNDKDYAIIDPGSMAKKLNKTLTENNIHHGGFSHFRITET